MGRTSRVEFRARVTLAVLAGLLMVAPMMAAGETKDPAPRRKRFSDALRTVRSAESKKEAASDKEPRPTPKVAPKPAPKPVPTPVPEPAPKPVTRPKPEPSELGYGYSPADPIRIGVAPGEPDDVSALVAAVRAERTYLRHLRDARHRPFRHHRVGSVMGHDGHVLDKFELRGQDGRRHLLYIDMYHPDAGVLTAPAPKGMTLWNPKDAPAAE
ncbi:hypothetical protein HQ576_01815 [bacterium]|nr:hypothetical protein [bacterium]